jgi:Fe-S-cluster-containing hydrogenase component 2
MITIDEARCTGCGVCLTACPQGAIVLEAERAEIKQELCTNCGVCLSICPENAIQETEPAPVTRPLPSRRERKPVVAPSPIRAERTPTRARPLEVVRPSPTSLERRKAVTAVTAAASTVGPVALDLLGRLAVRWFRRGRSPERSTGGRGLAVRGPGGGRRRRWRGGRYS